MRPSESEAQKKGQRKVKVLRHILNKCRMTKKNTRMKAAAAAAATTTTRIMCNKNKQLGWHLPFPTTALFEFETSTVQFKKWLPLITIAEPLEFP